MTDQTCKVFQQKSWCWFLRLPGQQSLWR